MAGSGATRGVVKRRKKRASAAMLEMAEIPFMRAAGRAFRHLAGVRAAESMVDPDITERYSGPAPTRVYRRHRKEDERAG